MKNPFLKSPVRFFALLNMAVILLFSSCKQKADYSKEISLLDSTSAVLVTTEKKLLSLDTNALNKAYNAISANLQSLTEKLSKDTLKKNTAMLLFAAYEQTQSIHNLLKNKTNLARAVNESKHRINDLKHDLKENLIKENKSAEYIVNEIHFTEQILNTVNKAIERANISLSKLDSLKTEIAFLGDSLMY